MNPGVLPDTCVTYCDSTIALPLLTHYVLAKGIRRQPRRLCEQLPRLERRLKRAFAGQKQRRLKEGRFELPKTAKRGRRR